MSPTDVVIVGGGPGGYVAAIRLGQLKKKVTLIDEGALGGVCLNWGCIPSKALIHVAQLYEEMRTSEELGLTATVKFDLKKTQAWKRKVVEQLTSGVAALCKSAGVEVIQGRARFESRNRVLVNEKEAIEFTSAIVATGSKPMTIPGFEFDGLQVVDSQQALEWTQPPKRMVVIGGGVIGMEIGMLYEKFGTHLTVVEMTDQLLPGVDVEVAKTLARICKKRSIDVHLSSKALSYKKTSDGLSVEIETPSGKQKISSDVILLSVGRSSNGEGLGLERLGVRIEKGRILVNDRLQTNVPQFFAIGDVAGPPLLAHKASKEGLVVAGVIAGHADRFDVKAMPAAIFTDPEIAVVGLSEREAIQKGHQVMVGKFPFAASGRALAGRQTEGFVKVVGEKGTQLLLGVSIIGLHASDLISEAALAIEMGATVDDLALTVHPHPTLSEALMESAESALGHAIHTINRTTTKNQDHVRA